MKTRFETEAQGNPENGLFTTLFLQGVVKTRTFF